MAQEYRNIYQMARSAAGITQERAAEMIGVSTESMRAYEYGKRIPPEEVVFTMSEVYSAQYLMYQHARNNIIAARTLLPELSIVDLPSAILKVLKEVNDFVKRRDELVEITSDGIISADEKPAFDAILAELNDIVSAVMALKYAQ